MFPKAKGLQPISKVWKLSLRRAKDGKINFQGINLTTKSGRNRKKCEWNIWEINHSMKCGCKRNSGKEARVHESEEMATVFFWALLARLLSSFGRLSAGNAEGSLYLRLIWSIFVLSISGLWCVAFQLFQNVSIILHSNGNILFYKAEQLNWSTFFQFLNWIKYIGPTVILARHESTEFVWKSF